MKLLHFSGAESLIKLQLLSNAVLCPWPHTNGEKYAGRTEGPVRRARGRGLLKEFGDKGPLIFPLKTSSSALKRERTFISSQRWDALKVLKTNLSMPV